MLSTENQWHRKLSSWQHTVPSATTSRQVDDPLPSVKRKWYYDNTVEKLSKHNKTSVQKKNIYISVMHISQLTATMGCEYFVSGAPKTKARQADNHDITGSTVSCNDNALYHQRRQRCQNDDPRFQQEKKIL